MHELVVMGRRIGFGRTDWGILAHNEVLLRETLNFMRLKNVSQFPSTLERDKKIEGLAKLIILFMPYLTDKHWCIDCEANQGMGEKNGRQLLEGMEKLGMEISARDKRILSDGGCYQPWQSLYPLLGEALGVQLTVEDASKTFPKTGWQRLTIHFEANPTTSLPNMYLLKEALAKEKVTLGLDVAFPDMPTF